MKLDSPVLLTAFRRFVGRNGSSFTISDCLHASWIQAPAIEEIRYGISPLFGEPLIIIFLPGVIRVAFHNDIEIRIPN